ncbi:MAG: hypothetical protein HY812_09800 [Planctomycetes bacterium]|nr:hypothetical protein [Planctomycetota bacterium]
MSARGGAAGLREEAAGCLTAVEPGAGALSATFLFPRDLAVFAGHFPGSPLVPGVYLVEAVRAALERARGRSLRLVEVRDARFTAPVLPGDLVRVEVAHAGGAPPWSCQAVLSRRGEVAARIELVLALEEGQRDADPGL